MRSLLLGIVVGFALAVVLLMLMSGPSVRLSPPGVLYPYSRFVDDIDGGRVEEVTFQGSKIFGRFKDQRPNVDAREGEGRGRVFETLAPHAQVLPSLTDRLLAKKVTVVARPAEDDSSPFLAQW